MSYLARFLFYVCFDFFSKYTIIKAVKTFNLRKKSMQNVSLDEEMDDEDD